MAQREGGGGGGWREGGENRSQQLCTSLCGLNNTEWQDNTKQKWNRKRPMESSFQQPRVWLILPLLYTLISPIWVFLSLLLTERKAIPAIEVPRWVILFRTSYSPLSVCMHGPERDTELTHFFTTGPSQKLARLESGNLSGWKREGCNWEGNLGFNEALINGFHIPAAITQSPSSDMPGRVKSCSLLVHGGATIPSYSLRIDGHDV